MKIAVIGGGIGGLTAARALVAAGFDAHVLDANARPGGLVQTSRLDGYLREHAASAFVGGPPHGALALCDELGVAVETASPRAKRRWIYLDGALRALPRNPIELARSDLLTWRGKLALLREPFVARRSANEEESVHAFAARRLGAEVARAIVAPFVTGVFAADAHDVSLEAGFPRLAELDAAGGIVRGMAKQIVRGIGKRGRSERTRRGMFAPAGGLAALVDALAAELGPRVRRDTRVRTVAGSPSGVAIDGERWDGAVLAISARDAAEITEPELATRLRGFHRAPVALVYLGMPASAVPAAGDGFGFLVAKGEELRVLGVVFESTVWADRAPAGHVLLRCIFGGGRDPDAAALPDAELIAIARRDVEHALGARGELTHASVVKWQHGIAQYPVGHRDRVREAVATARLQRIALAGADYRGAAINELCADAAAVVAEVETWT